MIPHKFVHYILCVSVLVYDIPGKYCEWSIASVHKSGAWGFGYQRCYYDLDECWCSVFYYAYTVLEI